MGSLFNYDSPFLSGLGKLADLIILNLLTLLFCIPIVTVGASLTAAHYTALKLRRGEGYVIKNFWKSFKENFVQSTIIWLMLVFLIVIGILDYWYVSASASGFISTLVCCILMGMLIFLIMTSLWIYPVQSKFVNNIRTTIKNAFYLSIKYLPRTFAMLVVSLIPIVLALLSYQLYIVIFLLGFSGPIYVCAILYDKKFQEIEDTILEKQRETAEAEEGLN